MPPTEPASRVSVSRRFSAWFSAEEQKVFKVQIVVVFVIITLLELGYYRHRRLIEIDAEHNVQRAIHGWDGFAWYVWLLAAPATLVLIRRFPLSGERRARSIAGLVFGSLAIYVAVTNARFGLRLLTEHLVGHPVTPPMTASNYWHTETLLLPLDFITFCGFFGISFAIDYYFKYRQRADEIQRLQLEAIRLRAELTQSQLATLRGQLHPHFLFNAFNAISTLVRQRKNEFAVAMIAQLSALLRLTMENIDLQELTLEQELAFITSYLDVERVRFSDKLQTAIEAPPDVRACVVPTLLLQPLVENAIKHGISRRVAPGWVRLTAARSGDRLLLEISNDGADRDPSEPELRKVPGIGLRNTRSRLEHAYAGDYRLEIARQPGGRTTVSLDLPWREKSVPVRATPKEQLAHA
jgi:two-component system, LytTR family, sensor kinase